MTLNNVVSMLGQRRRRLSNSETSLVQSLLFEGRTCGAGDADTLV